MTRAGLIVVATELSLSLAFRQFLAGPSKGPVRAQIVGLSSPACSLGLAVRAFGRVTVVRRGPYAPIDAASAVPTKPSVRRRTVTICATLVYARLPRPTSTSR
jgi:hypothetical protein